jgi:signal transduction histidine kinase
VSLNAELVRRKLRKLPIPAEQEAALAEHLQLLRDEVARLEAMVSDFVSLAAGDVAQSADAVDLRDLVSAVLDVHAPNFEERGIALHVATGDDPVVVRVHSLRIQQVLHNLMTNALDALAGKDEQSVRVSIQRKSQSVEVRVRDTGPGLVDTNIVFSPTYSTKAGGGGMGLAISRQIARLHSGFLGAEKSADGGAEFVLSLPLAS